MGGYILQLNSKLKSTEQEIFFGKLLVPRQWLINPDLRLPILRILPSYSLSKFAVSSKFYYYFMASQANVELMSGAFVEFPYLLEEPTNTL